MLDLDSGERKVHCPCWELSLRRHELANRRAQWQAFDSYGELEAPCPAAA